MMVKKVTRLSRFFILLFLLPLIVLGCHQQTGEPVVIDQPTGPVQTRQSLAPSPSTTPITADLPVATATINDERRPGPGLSLSAATPDGSFWYTFDPLSGSYPSSQNQGLYRLLDGQVTHFNVPGLIRVLAVAQEGSLYIGAGCGLLRFQAETMETLLEVDCDSQGESIPLLFPMAIAFGDDDLVWVGGAHNLASFDGQAWQEYRIPATKIAVAPDGTIWVQGWDGREGSECCFSHLTDAGIESFPWSVDAPVPAEVLDILLSPPGR